MEGVWLFFDIVLGFMYLCLFLFENLFYFLSILCDKVCIEDFSFCDGIICNG